MDDHYVIKCPHCEEFAVINKCDMNCCIFRHGVMKDGGVQMNPHESKEVCDSLSINGMIYGCGKPFQMTVVNGKMTSVICGYI
jgi:hypothetical protein